VKREYLVGSMGDRCLVISLNFHISWMWDELGVKMGGSDKRFLNKVHDEVMKSKEDIILEWHCSVGGQRSFLGKKLCG